MTVKFISFFFLALSIVACANQRSIPLDIQCDDGIKRATKYLKATASEFDKTTVKKIENLIQAAKIQQQHAMFPSCIDKSQRALTLLKVDQTTDKSKK